MKSMGIAYLPSLLLVLGAASLALLSTVVYFRGKWSNEFSESRTRNDNVVVLIAATMFIMTIALTYGAFRREARDNDLRYAALRASATSLLKEIADEQSPVPQPDYRMLNRGLMHTRRLLDELLGGVQLSARWGVGPDPTADSLGALRNTLTAKILIFDSLIARHDSLSRIQSTSR